MSQLEADSAMPPGGDIGCRLVAIAGSGHSGSTLLALLLSQHQEVFNLSQSRDLWRAWARNPLCACGSRLRSCPVYGRAVPRAAAVAGMADPARVQELKAAFFQAADGLPDWADPGARAWLRERHARYLAVIRSMLAEVAQATGSDRFVDASKSPQSSLALSLLPDVELRVLNLVRDPRAVAHSFRRSTGSAWVGLRYAREWRNRQRRLDGLAEQLGRRSTVLRYEDLARQPKEALRAVHAWSQLPVPECLFVNNNRVRLDWSRQHVYPPANPKLLAERKEEVAIVPHDDWRGGNPALRALAQALVWPQQRKHYPRAA